MIPSFSREKVVTADLIYLNTDILALIFHRQIAITKIEISSPRVHLVRNTEGLVNIQTLFAKNTGDNGIEETPGEKFSPVAGAVSTPARTNGVKAAIVIPRMLIHAVRIENGALTFVDESFEPSLIIPLRQIDFQAAHLSFEKPFPFEARAPMGRPAKYYG